MNARYERRSRARAARNATRDLHVFAAAQRLAIGALVEKVAVAFSRFFRRLTVSLELTVLRRIRTGRGGFMTACR